MTETALHDLSRLVLDVSQKVEIKAALGDVYQKLIVQFTTDFGTPDNRPIPMALEPWPGGRWFRDLGSGQGHLWGFVQVIKPPTLLEIHGPLFMSYAAVSHLQYRLTQISGGTSIALRHRVLGIVDDEHRQGLTSGWLAILNTVKRKCE